MTRIRSRIVLALVFFVIACGSGSSGPGGDAGDEGPAVRGLLVRWRAASHAAGYVIHWGTASGAYTEALDVGVPEATADGTMRFLLEDVGAAGTIFFALTAYAEDGQRSSFSNEIAVVVP